ncbi:MAG: SDR family oxidoreductase [Candidatus Eisenbacteria bacterium]
MKIAASTKVMITGASGSVGWVLSKALAGRCAVSGTYASHPYVPEGVTGVKIDLRDQWAVKEHLEHHRPDVIVHLAAITQPDRCEENPQLAFRVNFEATSEIARVAEAIGARLVCASSDLIFDGAKGDYTEEDVPRPLSIYGMSKLRAEEAALELSSGALVVRSSLIYGFGSPVSKTFLSRVLEKLAQGEKMQLFTDQMRNPVLIDDLAEAVIIAIEKDLSGIYHIGGPEAVNRHEFGRKVCRIFGYDESLLVPISMRDFSYDAKRPLDSTLNTEKYTGATGFVPRPMDAGLKEAKESTR